MDFSSFFFTLFFAFSFGQTTILQNTMKRELSLFTLIKSEEFAAAIHLHYMNGGSKFFTLHSSLFTFKSSLFT